MEDNSKTTSNPIYSILYTIWNSLVFICFIAISVYLPLTITNNIENSYLYTILSSFTSVIFAFDILFNFYKHKSEVVKNTNVTESPLKKYINYFLIFDIIAVIPFVYFTNIPAFALFRFSKLVWLIKMLISWRIKYLRYSNQLRFIYFIFWMLLSIHWISCGWLAIRQPDPLLTISSNYLDAVYWAITTITSIGYGDIVPVTAVQKLYAIFAMLTGFAFYGYLIGNVVSLISKRDPAKTHFLENVEQLSVSVKYRNLPSDLQTRIFDFYFYKWKKRHGYDESLFLSGLPRGLKTEVSLHLKRDAIEKIDLFKDANQEFIKEIALQLKPVIITPGDYICKAGEYALEMYFVIRGELNVFSKDEKKLLTTLKGGDFFGEIALFSNEVRSASIKSNTYCDLYSLSKKSFDHILKHYPDIAKKILKKIEIRKERDSIMGIGN